MLIRALTVKDIPAWLALAHEGDEAVRKLVPDISVFYHGFDEYLMDKIKQHEAFIAIDRVSGQSMGTIAFSQKHNRISFIGISKDADFQKVGEKLMKIALNQLDYSKEITASVINSNAEIFKREHVLYERFNFLESGDIIEANVPAIRMTRQASQTKRGYSFHYDYPGYLEWMDAQKCPFCHRDLQYGDLLLKDHVLIKELEYSYVLASEKAQGALWGKCHIVSKKHFIELHDVPKADLVDFVHDVQKTTRALKEISGSVKINLEQHGNTIPHLHFHLYPRYLDDLFAGKAIDYNITEPTPYENEAEFQYFIEQMREKLSS
jgi:diadenosine tetraphosphate (Ap4A) HIT family hydrolase